MLINYFFIILAGFFISAIVIFFLKKSSIKYKFLISQKTPLVGGIGIGLSFILVYLFSSFIYANLAKEAIAIVISSLIIFILGIVDDWRELSVATKFFSQIAATALLVTFGIRTHIIYIGEPLNIIVTFIWVIGITNAFNHLDILDGLAAGTAIIVSAAFFTISLLNGQVAAAILSLCLLGSTGGFIIYNLFPARVYMGNSGSHFLGFIFAALALIISYAPMERKAALLSPLLIMGLAIFDTAFLIYTRSRQKRSIFRKSRDHIALRLLEMGYSKNKALLFLLTLCLFFSICGILVSQVSNFWSMVIVVFVILVSLFLSRKLSKVAVNV